MSLEVYINEKKLYLTPKATVALTLQINDIAQISKRDATFTNRFTAPKTPENKIVVSHMNTPGNTSLAPYKFSTARIVNNGITICANGTALLQETKNRKEFEFIIYSGTYDLFSKIQGKLITNLDWSDLVHKFTVNDQLFEQAVRDKYIYPMADTLNGQLNSRDTSIAVADAEYFVPHVFVKEIWDRIFSEAGLEYFGDFFATDDFTKALVPADYNYFAPRVDDYTCISDLLTGTNTLGNGNIGPFVTMDRLANFTGVQQDKMNMVGPQIYPFTSHFIQIAGHYVITFKAKCKNYSSENGKIEIMVNGTTTGAIWYLNTKQQGDSQDDPIVRDVYLSVRIYAEIGDEINVKITGSSTLIIGGPTTNSLVITISETELTTQYDSNEFYDEDIDFSLSLPPIKQVDFLVAIMQQHGLVYQFTLDGRYEFMRMQDLLSGVKGSVNLDTKFNGEVSEKYRLGAYKKENKITYSYFDKDKLGKGYADTSFSVDIDDIDDTGVAIASIIQASGETIASPTVPSGANTRLASLHSFSSSISPEALLDLSKSWFEAIAAYLSSATIDNFNLQNMTERAYKMAVKANYRLNNNDKLKVVMLHREQVQKLEIYLNLILNRTWTDTTAPTYPLVSFKELFWDVLVENNYGKFIDVVKRPVVKTVSIYFTPIDIYFLDFFKIVYITEYQSFFYLNKVTNFQAGKPTNFEIVKIN